MGTVIEFPKIFDSKTAGGVADALKDYVKDKPNAKILVVIKNDEADEISAGWNHMDSPDMLFLIEFAKYKWSQATFGSFYGFSDDEEDPNDNDE